MNDPIANLIDFYIHGPETTTVPQQTEVRRSAGRDEAQERFDAVGLPRGLAPVA